MSNEQGHQQTELFYDERFWEQYAGAKLVSDPVTAIVELVANSWDAGVKMVSIKWPRTSGEAIEISDDGEGMTKAEFLTRWGTLSYNRAKHQGTTVDVSLGDAIHHRSVFGRNGIGRFAAFCFGSEYRVTTRKGGQEVGFIVKKGATRPLEIELDHEVTSALTGTCIKIDRTTGPVLVPEMIKTELGRRFLTDPSFQVLVNGEQIAFEDIEDDGLETLVIPIPDLSIEVKIRIIDARRTDRTVRQHGVAWHVLGRLVGDCDWKDPEQKSLIDGRRVEAKRFTFIVEADVLQEMGAVKPDWSGFVEDNEAYRAVNTEVQKRITSRLLDATRDKRQELTSNVRRALAPQVRNLSLITQEKWSAFVDKVAEECPRLTEQELKSVSGILAKMELAHSQYALLHKLHQLTPGQIDDLHQIIADWSVDMAKVVLDEIRTRMKLVRELRIKTANPATLEVQELQPLFKQGLWIFGPEYETIHYTANEGMTKVIQELFPGATATGSRNRPDFAIIPDGSVGIYSFDLWDDQGGELGPDRIVIVELKAPDVPIGHAEKEQCYKYIRELNQKGLLLGGTTIRGFVLGRTINPIDRGEKTEMDGRTRILPMDFDTVLRRAESRLFKLHEKIRSAPFLQDAGIQIFLDADSQADGELSMETIDVSVAGDPAKL